jgi:hypothetical protein
MDIWSEIHQQHMQNRFLIHFVADLRRFLPKGRQQVMNDSQSVTNPNMEDNLDLSRL